MHPLFWDPELSRMHLHPQIQNPNAFLGPKFSSWSGRIILSCLVELNHPRSGLEKQFILILVQFLEIFFWNFLKKRWVIIWADLIPMFYMSNTHVLCMDYLVYYLLGWIVALKKVLRKFWFWYGKCHNSIIILQLFLLKNQINSENFKYCKGRGKMSQLRSDRLTTNQKAWICKKTNSSTGERENSSRLL